MTLPSATPTAARPPRRPRTRRALALATRALAVVGALTLVLLAVGLAADARSFDRTRGGYEPPYTGWTGTPIDWDAADVTDTGFRSPGRVADLTLDCTTGMIGVEVFGVAADYRVVSGRAVVVHQPREACARYGFTPDF